MGKTLSLIVLSALLFPAGSPAQGTAAQNQETGEAQYVALQADLFDEQQLTAQPQAVSDIARMLREIRSQFPAVANLRIPTSWTANTSLIVGFQRAFQAQVDRLCVGWSGYARIRSEALGVPAMDAITQRFGGGYELTCQNRGASLGPYVVVSFPRLLHVPSLARLYRAATGVTSAEDNRVILGGVMPVGVKKEGAQWRVTLGRGSGDCPAGCIVREYHHFLVAPDFTIQSLGTEQQGETPAPEPELPEDPLEETPEPPAIPQ
jgi:hypothetical protein